MTIIQDHIALHLRKDGSISKHNLLCLVGMIETGEATIEDMKAVGGDKLAEEVVKAGVHV